MNIATSGNYEGALMRINSEVLYVSRATLAARLDLSEKQIDDLVCQGAIPRPVKIGRHLRWRWPDVDQKLLRAKATPIPSAARSDYPDADPVYAAMERGWKHIELEEKRARSAKLKAKRSNHT